MDISIYPIPEYPPPQTDPIPASNPFEYPEQSGIWQRFYFRSLFYRNVLWHRWQYHAGEYLDAFVSTLRYHQDVIIDASGLLNTTIPIPAPNGGIVFDIHPDIIPIRVPYPYEQYTGWAQGMFYPSPNGLGPDDVPEGFLQVSHTNNHDDDDPAPISFSDPHTGQAITVQPYANVVNWFFIAPGASALYWLAPADAPSGRNFVSIAPCIGVFMLFCLAGAAFPARRRKA